MTRRSHLRALAESHGILSGYIDQEGQAHETSDESYVALLSALGVDATTEQAARRSLRERTRTAARWLIPRTRVTADRAASVTLNPAAVPGGATRPIDWKLEMRAENGNVAHASGQLTTANPTLQLPQRLVPGYYTLRLSAARRGGASATADQFLIVTPRRCVQPSAVIGQQRVFGLLANLYTVRSKRNWGVGDCSDLHALIRWSSAIGAAFVGVNPLHVLANARAQISPYNPVSRLFRNPLYVDVTTIPELAQTPAAARRIASSAVQRELRALRAASHVDYERVMALKLPVLQHLHRAFMRQHRDRDTPRGRAYRNYCRREGEVLRNFATFQVLRAHRTDQPDWHRWPATYRDCGSPEIERFRARHHDEIEFHCYLQFALDQQLEQVAGAARSGDVPIGIYQDLAIGSARDGSDTWAFRDLFVDGVDVGAPPDNYNAGGQNWSFPPLNPQRLRDSGYRYYTQLLRAGVRHAGTLRIDHVMGLVRQYWIPAGAPATQGAYVRVAADDLFGILALESHRARALIVGEDLGTVPPELPALLERWGVLSTRVLYFERNKRGSFRPASQYPARALVSANTHDLPPVVGFLQGRDLSVRHGLGLSGDDAAHARAVAERTRDTMSLLQLLRTAKLSRKSDVPAKTQRVRDAIHAFLSRTPAALLGIALDDLAAERDAVNVPGVGVDHHPSWSRRMGPTLEALRADPSVARSLSGLSRRRWKKPRTPR